MYKSKVIVMDIDGTLLNSSKKITPKTKEILLSLQSKGVRLILASGRPTSGLLGLAQELDLHKNEGLLVSFNGARITDTSGNEVMYNKTMATEDVQAVLNHMKKFDVIPMIYKDDYMYVNDVYKTIEVNGQDFNVIAYEGRNCNYKLCEIEDLANFASFPNNKILTAGNPEYLQDKYKEMMAPFKDSLNCVFTAPFYFEYTSKGIDKAQALDYVLTPLGYKRENIIAFGDSQNDKTMIEYAGIGIAMGNATEEIKSVANDLTLSNDEDGIYHALKRIFKENL